MAGLRLVPRSLSAILFGLAGFVIASDAPLARAQGSYTQYPDFPPNYRNSGNVITKGPTGDGINIDLNNRHTIDPLAPRTSERAAQRSAGPNLSRPLSQSFDPALQPDTVPTGATSAAPVQAPPPGTTRLPAQVPPRSAYPALGAPPAPAAITNGLAAPQATTGPLSGAANVDPATGPALVPAADSTVPAAADGTAQVARGPSPLGPPVPPTSSNPDIAGNGAVPVGPMVVDVRVEGNDTVKAERIRPHVKCRKGRPLDTLQVEEDVRRLLATRLFVAVRPKYIDVPGGVTVLFQVLERPTLKYVKYQGSHLRDRTLAKQTGLKKGSIADPFSVEEARAKLEQFFRDRGHNKCRVTVAEGVNPGDKGAVFIIHEGPIPRVRHVDFINNTLASDARLRTQVSTKTPWFRIPGVFKGWKGFADPEKINSDVDTLTDYYRGLGHFSAYVSREVILDESQELADVTFVIKEGPRYSLRTISFIGQKKFTEEELRAKLKLKPGDFFDRGKMKADVDAIEEKYGAKGYVFADIEASPRFELEPGQLDLVFKVNEGRRCRVGQITVQVSGENPHTRRLAILNRLSFRPGDIMDIRKLRDSERRLQASGLFAYKPQEGKEPKVTFSPPVTDTENLVENPDDKPNGKVRGQSPDAEDDEWVINIEYRDCKLPAEQPAEQAADRSGAEAKLPPGVVITSTAPASQPVKPADLSPYARELRARQSATTQPVTPHRTAPAASTPNRAASSDGAQRSKLPPGTVVRGQSPDEVTPATRTAPLQWRPVAPAGMGQNADRRPAADEPAIVRAQNEVGYPSSSDTMPSFNMQQPASRTPARAVPTQQPYIPTSSLPSSRPVVDANGRPLATPYVAQNNLAPPGGFAPGATTTPPTGYGQFVPNNSPPPPAAVPAWATPNVQPGQSGAAPAGQPGASPPGVLPAPGGYNSPEEVFGGPGERDWVGGEEPPIDVPVNVLVEETQTGRLMLGVGVNSNAGLVGSAVIDEQNFDWTRVPRSWADVVSGTAFRGAGQHFRIEAMPGTQFQRYLVSFTEPYLFDTPVSFGINGSYFVRQYLNWTEQRLGGRVSLGYQLAPDITLGGALRAESINISNIPNPSPTQLSSVLGNNALYTGRVNLVQDTRDSAFLPTQGRRVSLAFEQAFGGFSYPRGEIEVSQYFRLRQRADGSGRHVLRVAGQVGISGTDTPIFENFFAGGYSSIRGFVFRGASPIEMGVQVGGRLMVLGGLEYMFPITADDMLRGVVFCDTGTVEQDIHITSSDYRIAVGAGLRIQVPMMGPAPIALDFAVPVNKAPTDQTQVLSFFVGVQY